MKDAGIVNAAKWDEKIQANTAGKVATQVYGGWGEEARFVPLRQTYQANGVYFLPSLTADGSHAANLGGSSLAITANSKNKEAAYAYVDYALGTTEGQVTMLKAFGLVPSLLAALQDPFVSTEQPYWAGQKVWVDILSTLPNRTEPGYPLFHRCVEHHQGESDQISRRRLP